MFLPTTIEEIKDRRWSHLDIILITGDTYIDSPNIGVAIIGNILSEAGYTVGVIAQPQDREIMRLGEPRLFWGLTAGSFDSMVANFTATKKRRNHDDLTPGGINNRRPDRASIYYTNLIKRYSKNKRPIVIGGIEASIRRIAHYDYWDNKVRRSILFDAKADILVYGMAERTIVELASHISEGRDFRDMRGICYISKLPKEGYQILPSYEDVREDKKRFIEMFRLFYDNNDPLTAKGLCQRHGDRYLIHNPPQMYLSQDELDDVYELSYERDVHPFYKKQGQVRAMDTIKYSITSHRGCYGECNFCSISIHQGRTVISRSMKSILKEAKTLIKMKGFKGIISDVGGPTANMYGIECKKKLQSGACRDKSCLTPRICKSLDLDHHRQIVLLTEMKKIDGIRKIFIASGIRHDMILGDKKNGIKYLNKLIQYHISGQLKIAPEHSEEHVLRLMRKPSKDYLIEFKSIFDRLNIQHGKNQFLTYYFIAAHPGCQLSDMYKLKELLMKELKMTPEQVQIFTPLPSTYSSLMYYTETNPFDDSKIFVEKDIKNKERQKLVIKAPLNT